MALPRSPGSCTVPLPRIAPQLQRVSVSVSSRAASKSQHQQPVIIKPEAASQRQLKDPPHIRLHGYGVPECTHPHARVVACHGNVAAFTLQPCAERHATIASLLLSTGLQRRSGEKCTSASPEAMLPKVPGWLCTKDPNEGASH